MDEPQAEKRPEGKRGLAEPSRYPAVNGRNTAKIDGQDRHSTGRGIQTKERGPPAMGKGRTITSGDNSVCDQSPWRPKEHTRCNTNGTGQQCPPLTMGKKLLQDPSGQGPS